jgi:hypothetical protein
MGGQDKGRGPQKGTHQCCLSGRLAICLQDNHKTGIHIRECANLELRGPATAYNRPDAMPWVQGSITNISWDGSDPVGPYRWDVQVWTRATKIKCNS